MYTFAFGQCVVCFLFLVMVAVFSCCCSCCCSAFRIDDNSDSSRSSSRVLFAAIRNDDNNNDDSDRTAVMMFDCSTGVRCRHRRRTQQEYAPKMPRRVDSKKRRRSTCQEQNVARKAVLANTVVLAKAESMSADRVRNYSVSFRILKKFKTPAESRVVDDILRLTFLNDTRRMNCESEMMRTSRRIIKAQIKQSKEYYLFLNSQGNHNYTVVGMPVLNRRRKQKQTERMLRNVTRRTFAPTVRKPEVHNASKQPRQKVRLVCKAKGNPIPVIRWKKDNTFLNSTSKIRITYRGRQSTLVIRRAEDGDAGHYTCVAQGVDNVEKEASLWISNKEKCKDDAYCLNGGTCKYNKVLDEHICVCSDGYKGIRCAQKSIQHPAPVQNYMYYDDVV